MGKYQIAFTEEIWKVVRVEAVDEDDALEKFWEFAWDESEAIAYDGTIQDNVEVTVVDEDEETD